MAASAGVEVVGLARPHADRVRVGVAQAPEMALDPGKHDVAVMELAEDPLQVAGPPPRHLAGRPKQNSVASST